MVCRFSHHASISFHAITSYQAPSETGSALLSISVAFCSETWNVSFQPGVPLPPLSEGEGTYRSLSSRSFHESQHHRSKFYSEQQQPRDLLKLNKWSYLVNAYWKVSSPGFYFFILSIKVLDKHFHHPRNIHLVSQSGTAWSFWKPHSEQWLCAYCDKVGFGSEEAVLGNLMLDSVRCCRLPVQTLKSLRKLF